MGCGAFNLRCGLISALLVIMSVAYAQNTKPVHVPHVPPSKQSSNGCSHGWLYNRWQDFVNVQKNIFTVDALKVAASVVPFYVAARQADHQIHTVFYDRCTHTNKRRIPQAIYDVEHYGFPAILVGMCVLPQFSCDELMRTTGQVFMQGVLSIWAIKNIVKNSLTCDVNLRPWDERFSRYKRAYGGFPSGHTSEAIYMAAVYGAQFGPVAAIPLGMLAAFVWAIGVNYNRHYFSQVVAGAGLGAVYACASNKVISKRLSKDISINIVPNASGFSSVGISYQF